MNNDIKGNIKYTEKAYRTSEVATMLDIAVPTVRKYSQILESKGYTFLRGKGTGTHQARLFLEKDIMALRYLKDIREESGITVDKATNIVIEQFGKKAIQPINHSDIQHSEGSDKRYNELKGLIEQQNELIQGLTEKMDKQQEYIENSIKERDKLLLNTIDERMKERKELQEQEENKKGFFSKLFKK